MNMKRQNIKGVLMLIKSKWISLKEQEQQDFNQIKLRKQLRSKIMKKTLMIVKKRNQISNNKKKKKQLKKRYHLINAIILCHLRKKVIHKGTQMLKDSFQNQ